MNSLRNDLVSREAIAFSVAVVRTKSEQNIEKLAVAEIITILVGGESRAINLYTQIHPDHPSRDHN